MKKNLVQIIKENPGAVAVIDNDCWWLFREPQDNNPYEDDMEFDKWSSENTLARDGEVESIGEGYGSGCSYGGDILQALAVIVGLKVESV